MLRAIAVRARSRPLTLLVISVASVTCTDAPTRSVSPTEITKPPVVDNHPPSRSISYESMGTYTLGVTTQFDPHKTVSGPTTAGNKPILVRITATGSITTARSAYWSNDPAMQIPMPGSYGPSGFANAGYCYAYLFVGSSSFHGGEGWNSPSCTGSSSSDTLHQGYAILAGGISINRAAGILTGGFDCYNSQVGYGPCNTYVDNGQAVTLEKVVPDFSVTASPTSNANWGDTITVTVTVSPDTLGNREVPWKVDSTKWVPAYGAEWPPCGWGDFQPQYTGNPRVCRKPFTRSGTLTVYATVNATPRSESVVISVNKPKAKLTAVPNVIVPNSNVTFTPSVSPGAPQWSIEYWTWTPDSLPGGSGISNYCGWGDNPCTRQVSKTGTMMVKLKIGTDALAFFDSAYARVNCVPCLTNNVYLDSIVVRTALSNTWTNSSQANPRIERALNVFDSAGTYVAVQLPVRTGDNCVSVDAEPQNPTPGSRVLSAHMHPYSLGDTTCMGSVYGHGSCGFSDTDWAVALATNTRGMIMDADSIYIMTSIPAATDFAYDSVNNRAVFIGNCQSKSDSYARSCPAGGVIAFHRFFAKPEEINTLLPGGVKWHVGA